MLNHHWMAILDRKTGIEAFRYPRRCHLKIEVTPLKNPVYKKFKINEFSP